MGTSELTYTDPHVFLKNQIATGVFKGEQKGGIFNGEVKLDMLGNNISEYIGAKCSPLASELKEVKEINSYFQKQIENYREFTNNINGAIDSERQMYDMATKNIAKRLDEIDSLKEVLEDKRRITREIDVIMFGDNAAKNPALIDVMKSVQDMKNYLTKVVVVLENAKESINNEEVLEMIETTLSENIFK